MESCVLELPEMGREWDLLLVRVRRFQLLGVGVVLRLLPLLLDVVLLCINRVLFVQQLGILVLLDIPGGLDVLDNLRRLISRCLFL